MHKENITVEVNNRTYKVTCACTEEEREKGLQKVESLPEDEGMLFVFDEPSFVAFWMKDTLIPLDIIFIDEYNEVVSVNYGEPMNEDRVFEATSIKYVLEVNQGSDIQIGDDIEIEGLEEYEEDEEETPTMHVLHEDGSTQMELDGGERIFSRTNTKTLARLAKRAYKSKSETDYKALGRKVFAYLHIQDNKEDDYVELPD